ncbi:MAG: hypothetical protein IJD97_02875 [Clostridia bacterium]|nr:hypothetical protein [Clostridia bacterium]
MKKVVSLLLTLMMIMSLAATAFAEGEVTLEAKNATLNSGATVDGSGAYNIVKGDYFGFKGVDLTGINSIGFQVKSKITGGNNGETYAIKIDNPESGQTIGYITVEKEYDNAVIMTGVDPVSGTHDLYFKGVYGFQIANEIIVEKVILSKDVYTYDNTAAQVSDDYIKDFYADTWVAVDDFGRKVSDFEEAGPVKEGKREFGLIYWNWFGRRTKPAIIIEELIKNNPGSKDDYNHPAWDPSANYYWGEPLLGFYDSYDYWVYRKHAEMFAIAGVDALFFDYSNQGLNFPGAVDAIVKAFRDAKKAGVDVPGITGMFSLGDNPELNMRALQEIYLHCFVKEDYSDVWFHMDGKPMLYSGKKMDPNRKDPYEVALTEEITEFFTFRTNGYRGRHDEPDYWMWLENYPQVKRMVNKETGRVGYMVVGTGINQSTVNAGTTGVFSDPYAKGRGYSEAFGEDYTADGMRKAYFFREQGGLALTTDPEFVLVDGWNEWNTARYANYQNHRGNVFVDLYDPENSRDFEPNNGPLKDDYYLLMTDFIRKYKGVRPAPVASGAKTIDIAGDISQWNGVGPEFLNFDQSYERDSYGAIDPATNAKIHYTTTVDNAILSAKVSFDAENIYFLATTKEAIDENSKGFMNLYINTDRNRATGWEGYDFAVNVEGKGIISKANGNTWAWTNAGNVATKINGNNYMVVIPRSVLSETGTVDLEFKWTDSVECNGDILRFYVDGSTAPYGRFNYLYTEIEQTSLSASERAALSGTSILKAGAENMIVSGAKMDIYEKDTRVRAFEMNGTLYVPSDVFEEIMGYGKSKVEYDPNYNVFFTHHITLTEDEQAIKEHIWTVSSLDSTEVRVDGTVKTMSAPVIAKDNMVWAPLSLIADCYGWNVTNLGNGVYTVGENAPDLNTVNAVLSHLN